MHKGYLERSISDFTRAIELDPDLAFAYANRGLALLLQGKDSEAQKDFERCFELKPELKSELDGRIQKAKQLRKRS